MAEPSKEVALCKNIFSLEVCKSIWLNTWSWFMWFWFWVLKEPDPNFWKRNWTWSAGGPFFIKNLMFSCLISLKPICKALSTTDMNFLVCWSTPFSMWSNTSWMNSWRKISFLEVSKYAQVKSLIDLLIILKNSLVTWIWIFSISEV